jgi:hypothetical protein
MRAPSERAAARASRLGEFNLSPTPPKDRRGAMRRQYCSGPFCSALFCAVLRLRLEDSPSILKRQTHDLWRMRDI